MGVAADDSLTASQSETKTENFVSASGAMGTQSCNGLVLINSAGRILSKSDFREEQETETIAKTTGMGDLGNFRYGCFESYFSINLCVFNPFLS